MKSLDAAAATRTDPGLLAADAAIAAGQADQAREWAQAALSRAKATGDVRLEAQALASLANFDRLSSRNRRATEASARAALLFKSVGDLADEAIAHTSHANSAIVLARNEEAVEAALLSVELACLGRPGVHAVLAHNALGIAQGWSGNFEAAQEALDAASGVARRCQPPLPDYQLEVNRAWAECMHLTALRSQAEPRVDGADTLERLSGFVQRCAQSEAAGQAHALLEGFHRPLRALSSLIASLLQAWQGDLGAAQAALDDSRHWLRTLAFMSWIEAGTFWAEAEISRVAGNHAAAHAALVLLREHAIAVEHEQLACLSHLLAGQLHTLHGEHALAARELRVLREREQANRREALRGRAQVVQWQLDARRAQADLGLLQLESRALERLSFEDPLTGIANRRRLQSHLADRLAAAQAARHPLALALLDIDDFKRINDERGHGVGDRVLERLARLLASQLRESDLAARLGGDEFVVVFDHTDLATAQQVCARIHQVVAEFDWLDLCGRESLGVSIGVAQAQDGDNVVTLLRQADVAMYRSKRAATGGDPG